MTGDMLDKDLMTQAREEEMQEFRRHNVYVKVPLEECWEKTGRDPIGTRLVDINKGDELHPE